MGSDYEVIAAKLNGDFNPADLDFVCGFLRRRNPGSEAAEYYEAIFRFGRMAMEAGRNSEALELFGFCYRGGFNRAETGKDILEKFYLPHESEYRRIYEKNVANFSRYQHVKRKDYPAFEELKYRFLPYRGTTDPNVSQFAMINAGTGDLSQLLFTALRLPPTVKSLNQKGRVILLNDVFDTYFISWALEDTDCRTTLTMKIPLFIYFKNFSKFVEYLQIFDFENCLATERLVFIFGREELFNIIIESSIMPIAFHLSAPGADEADINGLIKEAAEQKLNYLIASHKKVNERYRDLTPALIAGKIADKSARMAFITTRFSTAIQYFARDCVMALKNLGYDARLIIEESDVAYHVDEILLKCFESFGPDLVFCIDRHRNVGNIPPQTVFVCWIQDFMPELFCREGAAKVGALDFVMNLFYSDKAITDLGYPPDRLIDAPMPVNPELYMHYDLTGEEISLYSTDLCYISNSGDMELSLNNFLKYFKNHPSRAMVEKNIRELAKKIFDDIYHEKAEYYDNEKVNEILKNELKKNISYISDASFAELTRAFKYELISDIQKVVPLLWLHEKGYKMKLWGKPWPKHPLLGKYAMGVAPNGETMSKILNASRISIGQNNAITLHPRLMEATLSGSLYIGNDIPEKFDLARAEKYLTEDEDFLKFHGREDLYRKIDRCLGDEDGRKRIVENGRKKILNSLTSEHLMKNVLGFIQSRIK